MFYWKLVDMLNYVSNKPYMLFLALIPAILLIGFIAPQEIFVLCVGNTYICIQPLHLAILFTIVHSFFALLYFVLLKLNIGLVKWMTVAHVLITIASTLVISILFQLIKEIQPGGGLEALLREGNFNENINSAIILIVFVITTAQFLVLINVIYALIKGRKIVYE